MPGMAVSAVLAWSLTAGKAESPTGQSPTEAGDPRAETSPASRSDPWAATELIDPSLEPRPLAGRSDNRLGLARQRKNGPGGLPGTPNGGSWVRTTASLGAVVGVIVLLGWGYRVMSVRGGGWRPALRGKHTPLIELVGRTPLSPRQSLCLVRIGPRLVLLGVTPDAVRALDVIDDADLTARLMGEAARRRADSSSAEFARCLEREARQYQPEGPESPENYLPDEERLSEVKRRLAGTIRRLRAAQSRAEGAAGPGATRQPRAGAAAGPAR